MSSINVMASTFCRRQTKVTQEGSADFTQGCACTALLPFIHMNYQILEVRQNEYFKHGIRVRGMLDFHAVRNWFSQTYGPCESLAHGNKIDNTHWSYEVIYQNYTVYVRGNEELNWFQLKHGAPVE